MIFDLWFMIGDWDLIFDIWYLIFEISLIHFGIWILDFHLFTFHLSLLESRLRRDRSKNLIICNLNLILHLSLPTCTFALCQPYPSSWAATAILTSWKMLPIY
jgi:hypothetical protein